MGTSTSLEQCNMELTAGPKGIMIARNRVAIKAGVELKLFKPAREDKAPPAVKPPQVKAPSKGKAPPPPKTKPKGKPEGPPAKRSRQS